jgi:hypothetical protein
MNWTAASEFSGAAVFICSDDHLRDVQVFAYMPAKYTGYTCAGRISRIYIDPRKAPASQCPNSAAALMTGVLRQ